MNRDDVIKILAEKGNTSNLVKSARKAIGIDYIEFNDRDDNDIVLDNIVDEILAQAPSDNHKFDHNDNDGMYWDPQGELDDLKEYHRHDGRRIFRGERTTIKNYPFMVSVHVLGRFWCGGSLYWNDLVLTSASCLQLMHNNRFFRENPKLLQVRIGSNHSRIGGEIIDALEVYFHPGYNPRTLNNNIAVIRLRHHLYFDHHRTPKLIAISYSPFSIPTTAEVLLLGWGVKKLSQRIAFEPVFLQQKLLPVYPNIFCKEVYGDKFVSSTMFCAGTMTTGEGACSHDAGGPAVMSGKLVGIISYGPSICGFPNAPTVFTLVGAYADWIETINETMPSYHIGKKKTTTLNPVLAMQYYNLEQYTSLKEKLLEHQTSKVTPLDIMTMPTEGNVTATTPGALRKKKLKDVIKYDKVKIAKKKKLKYMR
ncbi:Vitellin-degrading protease [Papilio machaon]|uniref:Vitellin-degrading protease n=1 Tax=Papilio machaon TaxID=76193 RepID=A0A0N1IHI0_PAPMA|nr:Vitellin-degrading protease [Papilio machaon]